jgi:hypothetical protein
MITILRNFLCLFKIRETKNIKKKENEDSANYLYCHKTKKRDIDPNNRWQCKDCTEGR